MQEEMTSEDIEDLFREAIAGDIEALELLAFLEEGPIVQPVDIYFNDPDIDTVKIIA